MPLYQHKSALVTLLLSSRGFFARMAGVIVNWVMPRMGPCVEQVVNRSCGKEYDRANRADDDYTQQNDAAFAALKFRLFKVVQSVMPLTPLHVERHKSGHTFNTRELRASG